uniref:DNA-directed RNA polymerase subunit n=1 Tax=Chenopodium quinoa TaxID=63459 RepID=A0A803LW19_CHEQI
MLVSAMDEASKGDLGRKESQKEVNNECMGSEGRKRVYGVANYLETMFIETMFIKVQLPWNVIIPCEHMDVKGLMLQKSVILRLMEDFAAKKATKKLGYLLAIFRGEVLEGTVHKVLRNGVFLRSGPIETMFFSARKMPGYQHVPGEIPMFIREKQSKIEKDVVVRFCVIGTK